jgi:hypothetical protein
VRLEETGHPLRFDDRLYTVLNEPAADRHDAAVRWRQLVDLVARAGPNASSPVVIEALEAIRSDATNVEEPLRAAAARAVAALPLPLGLLECFAADRLTVSAPVLAVATLDPAQWRAMIANSDAETRRFVETLHPELASPPTADATEALIEPAPESRPEPASGQAGPSLGDVVARIERRRRKRAVQQATGGGAFPPGSPALVRWECGPSGEIAWVEGAPRGPLVGRSIARAQDEDGDRVGADVARAFAMRAPFRDAIIALAGEGPVAGEWKISGVPAFELADGRFAGYRGVAMREAPRPISSDGAAAILPDPDSLRELVHEIKTPLNAIIGFAEIIDGQFLGPADHGYRQRATDIVAQARLLLGAIDDLDFAAKIHSSSGSEQRRTNLGELVERMAPLLREQSAARGVALDCTRTTRDLTAAVEPELADRLIFRLCSAIIARAEDGEHLRLSVDQANDHCRVSIGRPAALYGIADTQLFDATPGSGGRSEDGVLSGRTSLRLVRGLAHVAGADIATSAQTISLVFPRA